MGRVPCDLDPVARALAHGNPFPMGQIAPQPGPVPTSASHGCAVASVERVFAELVRRVAWSGDGRRGSVRIEIGAGSLAGAVLLVQADSGAVEVSIQLPSGSDPGVWRNRIAKRLEKRGLQVSSLEVG